MGLLHVIFVLVIFGVLLWAINKYIPMQPTIKNIINIVAVIAVVLWLLSIFFPGFMSGFHDIPVRSN